MSRRAVWPLTLAHLGRSTQTRCTASDITPIRLSPQRQSKNASRHALLRLDSLPGANWVGYLFLGSLERPGLNQSPEDS
jgi:hypothetical protein